MQANGNLVVVTDIDDVPIVEEISTTSPAGLGTGGGQSVAFIGKNLGSGVAPGPNVPFIVSASYMNAQGDLFLFQDCVVREAHVRLACSSVPGFGTGYRARIWMNVL